MVKGHFPGTIREALEIRKEKTDTLFIAGGTDVMVVKKTAQDVIFINQIPELKVVKVEAGVLTIGAGATYQELLANDLIPDVLKEAFRRIASPAIRAAGTLAGNICNASPAGDSLPVLYGLDARVILAELDQAGQTITKTLPIEDFILGIRKIALESNQMLVAIEIDTASYENISKKFYEKVGARQSEAISKLSFFGQYKLKDGIISDISISFGSVGITVVRDRAREAKLIGMTEKQLADNKESILADYMEIVNPITDQRSTAEYRKTVSRNLLEAFITG